VLITAQNWPPTVTRGSVKAAGRLAGRWGRGLSAGCGPATVFRKAHLRPRDQSAARQEVGAQFGRAICLICRPTASRLSLPKTVPKTVHVDKLGPQLVFGGSHTAQHSTSSSALLLFMRPHLRAKLRAAPLRGRMKACLSLETPNGRRQAKGALRRSRPNETIGSRANWRPALSCGPPEAKQFRSPIWPPFCTLGPN